MSELGHGESFPLKLPEPRALRDGTAYCASRQREVGRCESVALCASTLAWRARRRVIGVPPIPGENSVTLPRKVIGLVLTPSLETSSRRTPKMIIREAKPLFAWGYFEDSPSLKTLRDLLAAVPDRKLLESLRVARGTGKERLLARIIHTPSGKAHPGALVSHHSQERGR